MAQNFFSLQGNAPTADGVATFITRNRFIRPPRTIVTPTPGLGQNASGVAQTAFFSYTVAATELGYRDSYSGQTFTEQDTVSDVELKHFPESTRNFDRMVNIIQRNGTRRGTR